MTTTRQPIPPAAVRRARSDVYGLLLAALDKPSGDQHTWLRSQDFAQALRELCRAFAVPAPDQPLVPGDYADYESSYLAAFEVGLPRPPVVLLASAHNRREPAQRVLHEHLLLYRCFGTAPARGNIEPADHVLTQLAFLMHLDDVLAAGQTPAETVLRARRDFLARHAASWPRAAADQARENELPGLFQALLALLAATVEEDLALTEQALSHPGDVDAQ